VSGPRTNIPDRRAFSDGQVSGYSGPYLESKDIHIQRIRGQEEIRAQDCGVSLCMSISWFLVHEILSEGKRTAVGPNDILTLRGLLYFQLRGPHLGVSISEGT
jgi:hypothetical protein